MCVCHPGHSPKGTTDENKQGESTPEGKVIGWESWVEDFINRENGSWTEETVGWMLDAGSS